MKNPIRIKDLFITIAALCLCFLISIPMEEIFNTPEQITTTFAFTVFIISFLTEGYLWGLLASLASVLLVNYAFTFPYFSINFLIPSNFYSAIIMAFISFLTSTLTTKIKIQEAARAESAMEIERSNLLRAISHDLRTPLTTIYGSSTALIENGDAFTPEQRERMLKGIQQDSIWLVRIVENLLSVTRFDSNRIDLQKTVTALDELIDSVMQKFYKHYPDCRVELKLPDEIVLIPMDALLIEQVLINLFENAVKHAEGFTRITLTVSENKGKALFEVADDGCGIDESRLNNLFSMAHGANKPMPDALKRNAGIGLAVCATIIRAHGGSITAENPAEGGAKFTFTLNTEEIAYEQ